MTTSTTATTCGATTTGRAIRAVAVTLLLLLTTAASLPAAPFDAALAGRLEQLLGTEHGLAAADTRVRLNPDGYVRHLGAAPGGFFDTNVAGTSSARATGDAATLARAFMREWSDLFVAEPGTSDYATLGAKRVGDRWYVRLQQLQGGLPIFGGQAVVQLDGPLNVTNVQTDLMRALPVLLATPVGLRPSVSGSDAGLLAIDALIPTGGGGAATEAELMIYDPAVVGATGATQLVWRTVVESTAGSPIKEMVLVNAHSGAIAFHYTLIHEARIREIYDANGTTADPGTLARTEGDPASPVADVNAAYDFYGDTYEFYASTHGRDSFDDSGAVLSATVRHCDSFFSCPMQNAYWDGSRMYFGDGFAVDDVVAHELTHAVTDYESDLIYANESGALNESFSDIWGEFVDLTNGAGTDTPAVRWLMGEDLPIGAIRDMADPTAFGDPDRLGSPHWHTAASDNGGVHINSGVNNKLAYLLTDGDTFNGQTITGMGIARVAELYYECQTNLLTAGADYVDLYDALTQAAINLGFSAAERANLEAACQAVEISHVTVPTTNDQCSDGICVTDGERFTGSTASATGASASTCGYSDGADVWHTYRPTVSGPVTISTAGSAFDTTLAVMDACGGTALACDDDASFFTRTSEVVVSLSAGQTYRIRVAGYEGQSGDYVLTVTGGNGTCGPVCGNGVVDTGEACDLGAANGAAGSCCTASCQHVAPGTTCRAADGVCDVAEVCTGRSATCPADTVVAAGTPCTDDGNECTDDVCNAAGRCTHPVASDAPEECDDGWHFLCYRSKQARAPFGELPYPGFTPQSGLSVEDAFGERRLDLPRLDQLCTPADTDNGDPAAAPTYLEGYRTKLTRTLPRQDRFVGSTVDVATRFGTVALTIKRPRGLLIPTAAADGDDGALPLDPTDVPSYRCYQARGPRLTPQTIAVSDHFGNTQYVVKRITRYCTPANVDASDPTAGSSDERLVCYQAKRARMLPRQPRFGKQRVSTHNVFGDEVLDVLKPAELCVPATDVG